MDMTEAPNFSDDTKFVIQGRVFSVDKPTSIEAVMGFARGLRHSTDIKKQKESSEPIPSGKPKVTILGSFRFKEGIDQLIDRLTEDGIEVLAPPKGRVVTEIDGFKFIEGDAGNSEADVWSGFIQSAAESDALYVYNPRGYIGTHVTVEIGLGQVIGLPMYALEDIEGENVPGGNKPVKRMEIKDFTEMMMAENGCSLNVTDQAWVRDDRSGARIFAFTDLNGERAMFIDVTEF